MAEPTAPVIPPSAAPETMEMTTIIENGQTIILPMQRIATGLAQQSGLADGWAGLGLATTTGALLNPVVGTTKLPMPVPSIILPPAPGVTSAVPVVPAVSAGGVVVVPPGAATSVPPVSVGPAQTTAAKVVEGVVPPVLQDNDKPSVVVVSSTSRTTIRPTSTNSVVPPVGLLSIPPKPTTTSRQVLTLNPGLSVTSATSSGRTSSTTSSSSAIPTTATTSTSTSALALVNDLPSTTRRIWNLVDTSTDEVATTAGLNTGGLLNQGPLAGATSIPSGGAVSKTTQNPAITSAPSNDDSNPKAEPTLPSPGSPDESNVRALVSSYITLSGTAAVAAIKSGVAVQLESANGDVKGTTEAKGGLNEFVIAGIVAGVVLVLIIIIVVWYRWRKKSKAKAEEEESQPPMTSKRESGFDFSDDPVTASTGRMRRGTISGGQGPFDDRYQSQYGPTRESYYNPDLPIDQAEDDGYPFFRNVPNQPTHPPYAADDGYFSPTSRQDPLDALYGHAIEAEQARREVENPFAPPVPPLPASVRQSAVSGMSRDVRPTTGMTDIYGAYGSSRPGTQVDDRHERLAYERDDDGSDEGSEDDDDDRDRPAKTPSTSSLLPWLKNASPPPPVPSLPKASGHTRAEVSNRERREDRRKVDVPESVQDEDEDEEEEEPDPRAYTRYVSNAAGMGANGGGKRGPARPAMAQTPAGVGGNSFGVAIPGFR